MKIGKFLGKHLLALGLVIAASFLILTLGSVAIIVWLFPQISESEGTLVALTFITCVVFVCIYSNIIDIIVDVIFKAEENDWD